MDNRHFILKKLKAYKGINLHEEQMRVEVIDFVNSNVDCFKRSLQTGHIIGSAWVLDYSHKFTLLTHHAKLNKWFQLGGHSDGDPDTLAVAMREAWEESGLKSIKAVNDSIFDVDVHIIPARGDEPEHKHYDIRFLFEADLNEELKISTESKALAWVELDQVYKYNSDVSSKRMVKKS